MFTIKDVPRSLARFTSLMLAGNIQQTAPDEDAQKPGLQGVPGEARVEVIKLRTRRLDGGTCLQLRPLLSAAWNHGARTVVLDLQNVVFIDSLGISALISEQRRRPAGTRIVVSALGDFVRDVFEVTQLFEVFDVFGTSEACIASLAA
jgi:anti-anti-sigma factor